MHEHDTARLAAHIEGPVERRIAAAEDHQILAVKARGVLDAIVNALALESLGAFEPQPSRLERAHAARDHDRARVERRAQCRLHLEALIGLALHLGYFLA